MSYINDDRVDLTEDRDFRGDDSKFVSSDFAQPAWLSSRLSMFAVWSTDFNTRRTIQLSVMSDPFPTGSAEEIKNVNKAKRLENDYTCPRCGAAVMPWSPRSICEECYQKQLEKEGPFYPWDNNGVVTIGDWSEVSLSEWVTPE